MNFKGIINHNYFRKAVVICFAVVTVSITTIAAAGYAHRIVNRLEDNLKMISQHKTDTAGSLVKGNILFLANSSSTWIFPATDFNCYFFVKQNRINRNTDTVFNVSLIAEKNIQQINNDIRSSFDTQVYWENEDFRRYLFSMHNISSFGSLKAVKQLQVIKEYAAFKNTTYILTDEENMKIFPAYTIVKKFPANYKYDHCFSYSLMNDIYLIRVYE